MTTKLGVGLVTLSMIATTLLGAAAALPIPAGGAGWVGPRPQDNCSAPQALGFDGNAAGSAGGTGANGYHSYANDPSGIILDSCLGGTNVGTFLDCTSNDIWEAIIPGLQQIQEGVFTQNVDQIQEGINTITVDLLSGYWDCGGLAGTGTDGEFEYGTLAAALNVREGPGPGNNGDGTDSCIGDRSSAHHANDTTVYVSDLVWGGSVGFSISADWARPAGLSDDNTNLNNRDERPEISHCGDGAIEPCHADAHPGLVNQLVTYGGPVGAMNDVVHAAMTPLSHLHALDVVFGCNPLDCTAYQPPGAITGPNAWVVPGGQPLASFCNGGASGWLLVTVGVEVVHSYVAAPIGTVGWVWTG